MTRNDIGPADDWHFKHNALLLAAAHLHLGHDAEAERLLKEIAAIEPRGFFGPYSQSSWVDYLLLQGRFQEALEEAGRLEKGKRP